MLLKTHLNRNNAECIVTFSCLCVKSRLIDQGPEGDFQRYQYHHSSINGCVNLGCQFQPCFGEGDCLLFLLLSLVVLPIKTGFFTSKCEESKLYSSIGVTAVHHELVTDKSNNLRELYFSPASYLQELIRLISTHSLRSHLRLHPPGMTHWTIVSI